MLLGCIADDFTGASDLANTLAKSGMQTVQFCGLPSGAAPEGCEAGVVALKTRSIPAREAVDQSLAALDWLKAQGCRQFLFKYCSTFDSTPQGNIGPVAAALAEALDAPIAVVCPVFPTTGRTLYMGHLFVGERLLNESGMEHHPLNPMTDANLPRWLARQTSMRVGHVGWPTVVAGAAAISGALDRAAAAGTRLAVVDAITDDDLRQIGRAVARHRLVTGGSGIALGLADNFRAEGLLGERGSSFRPVSGPGVALCGSCSIASQGQVAAHAEAHPGLAVSADDVLSKAVTPESARDFVLRHRAEQPIVYSTADASQVAAVQASRGREAVAVAIEEFFGRLAVLLVADGFTRIAVGGGETSGAVVGALGISAFDLGPEIAPGVPALSTAQPARLGLALKSGNFGDRDFFEEALAALGVS